MADPDNITLAVDAAPVITAALNAAGAVVKLTADELAYLNSPQMIASRQAAWEQNQREEDIEAVTAAEAGNLTELRERSS